MTARGPEWALESWAKGSSDRIANKNMRVLEGEHLFKRKLRQLLECPLLTQVCLIEDDQIAEIAADLPVARLRRTLRHRRDWRSRGSN
jgi:CMP-N-acetylneuraminic acid synthetase